MGLSKKQLAALAAGRRKLAKMRKKGRKRSPSLAEREVKAESRRSGKKRAKARTGRAAVRRISGALGRLLGPALGFIPSTLKRWF